MADETRSHWREKTLLLLFSDPALDEGAGGGGAAGEVVFPVGGGTMPDQQPGQRWHWQSRGGVRLRVRSGVKFNGQVVRALDDRPPIRHFRFVSRGSISANREGLIRKVRQDTEMRMFSLLD